MSRGDGIHSSRGSPPGGRSHSLDEWIDVTKEKNVQAGEIVLATIMAASDAR